MEKKIANKIQITENKIKSIRSEIKQITQTNSNLILQLNDFQQKNKINEENKKKLDSQITKMSNWQNLRTNYLKEIRDEIKDKSGDTDNNKIRTHILDAAIKLACANYKSCITNLKEGNIKKFRMRYWNMNKNSKIMEIESCYISNNQILGNLFGEIKYEYNGEEYELNTTQHVTIIYYKDINEFKLLVPETKEINQKKITNRFIGLDQGNKTFATGYTNNSIVKYGTNLNSKIIDLLTRIDKLNKDNLGNTPKKKKKRKVKRYWRKIKNMVTETHWKVINNITKFYSTVVIGNLSTKQTAQTKANSMSKRVGHVLQHYQFRKRLEYKCSSYGIKMKVVDEAYTTKVCSVCGKFDETIKNENILKCKNCKRTMDRDSRSARGITIVGLAL